ncbi:MAG: VWA domain-containing protein [Acidobacteriia bacterium]|nr:VWA domain-containing protein [Terriglobia bacterium]
MYLLNLTFLQFAALFGSISALALALYLLDRSRRRQVVSTLRFWAAAGQPAAAARRRRIQQPWSLILQLAGMALLLLAIAQLHFGKPGPAARDHVLILDASAWMNARSGKGTLMDIARLRARQYIRALPARDRIMLVRADGLATPATPFEPDRAKLDAAILASHPGAMALNLDRALAFARHIQAQTGGRAGEIAFIGAGRTVESASPAPVPPNLRVILVPDAIQNCGLRRVGMRRSAADPDTWEIYVSAHNYGSEARNVTLTLDFAAAAGSGRLPVGSRTITLPPGADAEAGFRYHSASAGTVGVELLPHDPFPADDRAELEAPAQPVLPVTVYSGQPELLSPVLASNPRVSAVYRKPSEYRPDDRGLVVLDRFIPPVRPTADSLWIDPPASGSPIPVRQSIESARIVRWDGSHPIGAGLRTKDLRLERASIFEAAPDDAVIAAADAGPVIVARGGTPKIVVFGFHPSLSPMRYELATPLLFAGVERWAAPEVLRRWEIIGGGVGVVKLVVDEDYSPTGVKVAAADGTALPFTLRGRVLHFFSGAPGAVRVTAGDREYVYSLTLPEPWEARWQPPAGAARGIPRFVPSLDPSSDPWPLLAALGAAILTAEWILFGRGKRWDGRFRLFLRPGQAKPHARPVEVRR